MNLLATFDIAASLLQICALAFMLADKRKILSPASKVILMLLISIIFFVNFINVLEYMKIGGVLKYYKVHANIFIPILWALLIFSIQSEITRNDLIKSLNFQELALDGANQGLWSWDIITGECTFNDRWLNILGYGCDEIGYTIQTWEKLMDPEDKARVDDLMQSQLRGETEIFEVEQRLQTKSGGWKWVLDRGRVIKRDEDGKPLFMAGTLQDITHSKILSDKLSASKEIYKTVFENTGAATVIIEADATISKANERAAELMGCSPEDIEGVRKFTDFVTEEDLEMMLDYHNRRRQGDKSVPSQYEFVFKAPNGNNLNVLATVATIPNSDKSVASLLDLSDYKKSEQRRIEMEREMRYAQRLESLGVMAGGIAHDFNNLLMVILGNADLINQNAEPDDEIHKNSDEIIKASRKAADICKQMLAYSGDQNLVIKNIDMNMEINKISKMLKMSIANNAVLQYRLADNIPPISGDVMQLRQLLLNLVSNASEAVERDSGYITLATGSMDCSPNDLKSVYVDDKLAPGTYVYVKVYDTGVGMNDETQRHIFDPFFTTKFPGRGLGMSTVLGIVRSHKGVVKVDSELENGTTVTVLLPVAYKKSSEISEYDKLDTGESPSTSDPKLTGKVLLVDDDENVAIIARAMLESFGLEVLPACNGLDALEKFRQTNDIDCIITDLSMPRMGGEAATREIRKINSDIPILVSSGYDETKIRDIFKDLDIQGIIGKPYERSTLYDKLNSILGS